MKQLILDASIISKWFIEENHTDKALQIRDLYAEGKVDLILPILILFELGNVLWKHPLITLEDAGKAFKTFLDLGIELRNFVEAGLLIRVIGISRKLDITFYDAAYVALSKLLNAKFITADEELHNKIKGFIDVSLLTDIMLKELR